MARCFVWAYFCSVRRIHLRYVLRCECGLHALRRKILERKIYRRTHKFNKICDVAANKFKTKFRTACGTSAFYGEVAYCKMRRVLHRPGAENRSACERVCNGCCGVKFCSYRALFVCDFAWLRFVTLLSRAESRRDTPARVKYTRLCIKR